MDFEKQLERLQEAGRIFQDVTTTFADNIEKMKEEERRLRMEVEKMGLQEEYPCIDFTPFNPHNKLSELMQEELDIMRDRQRVIEENPLEAYSTTQLKAELRRRKKQGCNRY